MCCSKILHPRAYCESNDRARKSGINYEDRRQYYTYRYVF